MTMVMIVVMINDNNYDNENANENDNDKKSDLALNLGGKGDKIKSANRNNDKSGETIENSESDLQPYPLLNPILKYIMKIIITKCCL